jgi:hypothetical protein
MAITTLLTTLLTTFAIQSPNLCEDVYLDAMGTPLTDAIGQTFSRYCEWTGPDAPVWDADVCCTIDEDGAHCSQTLASGRCETGLKMYCEYGAVVAETGVVCYQPFPSMCEAGLCVEAPDSPPPTQAGLACCGDGGACVPLADDGILDCVEGGGYMMFCHDGMSNTDGTITCYD